MAEEAAKARKPKRRRNGASSLQHFRDDVNDRIQLKQGDWSDVTPQHLVALYAVMHAHLYKVEAEELADYWQPAVSMARRLLEVDFAGDGKLAVDFVRWSWHRERKRMKPDRDFRITWRYQFSKSLLTDYRRTRQ